MRKSFPSLSNSEKLFGELSLAIYLFDLLPYKRQANHSRRWPEIRTVMEKSRARF
jgi:hypothetical protein